MRFTGTVAIRRSSELFGWEARETMPPDSAGKYFVCRLRGRDVAAVGSARGGGPAPVAAWGTCVWVESADATTAAAVAAGGSVVAEPFDLLEAARMAVLADPAGAVFCAWEAGEHRGAQVVNEPGAWAMSALNTPDPEGGEPQQPVSREVVATMMPTQSPDDVPPHWSVDFWVVAPFDLPIGRTAALADPQGAAFSITTIRPPA